MDGRRAQQKGVDWDIYFEFYIMKVWIAQY
jgi:hypothetical protein